MATPVDSFSSEAEDSELHCQSVFKVNSCHGSKVVCGDSFLKLYLCNCSEKSNDFHTFHTAGRFGYEHYIYYNLFQKNTGQQFSESLYFPLTQLKNAHTHTPHAQAVRVTKTCSYV